MADETELKTELKPCPFCNGTIISPSEVYRYPDANNYICTSCGAQAPKEIWNTRPAPTSDVRERAERAAGQWFAKSLAAVGRHRTDDGYAFADHAYEAQERSVEKLTDIIANEFADLLAAERRKGFDLALDVVRKLGPRYMVDTNLNLLCAHLERARDAAREMK